MPVKTDKNPFNSVPGFKFKGQEHVIQTFDSFGDVFRHIEALNAKDSGMGRALRSTLNGKEFVGGQTYSKAQDGCVLGSAKLGGDADSLMRKVDGLEVSTEQRKRVRSVAGGRPCVPAVVSGSMVPMRRKVTQKHSYAPLSVVVNVNSSGMVDARTLEQRGVAIAALVKLLSAKRPVDLYVMGGLKMSGQRTYIPLVKFPANPVDIKRLAYVLASQGVARGLFFALSATANAAMDASERISYSNFIQWPFSSFDYIGDEGSKHSHSARNIGADLASWLKTDMLYIPGIFGYSKHVAAIKSDAAKWINDTVKSYTETKEST